MIELTSSSLGSSDSSRHPSDCRVIDPLHCDYDDRCSQIRQCRWPLRPEAKYRRGLPAPQHVWPGTGRPWMSAGVHRCQWRLSLTWSLGRSRATAVHSPLFQVCAAGSGVDRPPDLGDMMSLLMAQWVVLMAVGCEWGWLASFPVQVSVGWRPLLLAKSRARSRSCPAKARQALP